MFWGVGRHQVPPAPTCSRAATWVLLYPAAPTRPRTQQMLAGLESAKMKIE